MKGNNSLLEKSSGAGDLALIDRSFAAAGGLPGTATPKAGYVFNVLTQQGAAATGGSRSYLTGTAMTLGYAVVADAGAYDGTGRDTFMINNNGTIFQADRGLPYVAVTSFNPAAPPWTPSE